MRILAIDPGNEQSAYVLFEDGKIIHSGKISNSEMLGEIGCQGNSATLVVEQIESFGMAVGREVFETVWWAGRFAQAAFGYGATNHRLPRKAVKIHLCGTTRATDSNIRTALIDRYGGKEAAIGSKKKQGPLYRLKQDQWSALAIALAFAEVGGGHCSGCTDPRSEGTHQAGTIEHPAVVNTGDAQ